MKHNPNNIVQAHGVREQNTTNDPLDLAIEEVSILGYTVLENVLSADEADKFSSLIDSTYEAQISDLGGEEVAQKVGDSFNIRCPFSIDQVFLDLAMSDRIHDITKRILGDNYVLMMQNAVISNPSSFQHQTLWHRDLNYQHWVSTRPLIVNALYCIDDFTLENGCTHALVGSHKYEKFPSEDYILKHETGITAKKGDVIFMDSMVYHRTGYNSTSAKRRAVNHVIGLPFMAQQLNIPKILGDDFTTDEFQQKFLGYKWAPADDAKTWRLDRLKK